MTFRPGDAVVIVEKGYALKGSRGVVVGGCTHRAANGEEIDDLVEVEVVQRFCLPVDWLQRTEPAA